MTFAAAFCAGEARATALLPCRFDVASLVAEARARAQRLSPSLLPAMRGPAEAIGALADGASCVVTGQQLGFWGGPLLTLYKTATAIALAAAVEKAGGRRCVPVFWLQSEDHDWDEIRGVIVDGHRFELPADDAPRVSLADRVVPVEARARLSELALLLDGAPHAAQVTALLDAAWQPGRAVADAFADTIAAVFAGAPLVFVQPRCAELARAAAPLHRRALDSRAAIDDALAARGRKLDAAGFAEQVKVRPGSPLFFVHDDERGPRRRLEPDFDAAAVARLLEARPLCASTSALFRPIVQDALLPALAYVAGPAELAYLAQTAVLYPLFDVRPSLAVPRLRARLVDAKTASLLRALELQPADAERPRAELLGGAVADAGVAALRDETLARIAELGARPSLARAAERTRATVATALDRFAAAVARDHGERDAVRAGRVDKLQTALCPGAVPQERIVNFAALAARAGLDTLGATLVAAAARTRPGTVEDIFLEPA